MTSNDRTFGDDERSFGVGDVVGLRADRTRRGPIIAIEPPMVGGPRYRVWHSDDVVRVYDEDQLVAVASNANMEPFELLGGPLVEFDEFRARFTAARLTHHAIDNLYALHAARIQYIPFQFKPLLRLLRSDRHRLLIADDVGVGKTIEAGLILRELDTRGPLANVLVVCPKALATKWQKEMRRFDEDFQILTPASLRYCLNESHLGGAWPQQYARAIVNYELFRLDDYLHGVDGKAKRGLTQLDSAPVFDLVIFDEAHHVRNPTTNAHQLAETLCDAAEAVVFLTATPVQLGSRDLFELLHLLRPELFPSIAIFDDMAEPNRYLTRAVTYLRTRNPRDSWHQDASRALERAASTSWGRNTIANDPRFVAATRILASTPSDDERVRLLRDVEELHSFSHTINRTRRRDIGRFTIREPHTVSVDFLPEQRVFYDAVLAFRNDFLLLEHDPRVVRLILDTLERQTASCLPALVPALDSFLATGRFDLATVTDDPELDDEIDRTINVYDSSLQDLADKVRAAARMLPLEDPKLDALHRILDETRHAASGPGKLLVFSFFLHTLAYLHRELTKTGARVAVINGRLSEGERQELRDRFRLDRASPEALDVLLSSEVGCEGLDYEFCDRLVNYDIPWNPMRIEQRIGRIDRFGQQSDKVMIFNFVTPETVEHRIFFRCFERIGIFQDTIGDLEAVLGELVADLNQIVLDPSLSDEQRNAQALQRADNIVRLADEQRRLDDEAQDFIGVDHGYAAEVDSVSREARYVSAGSLRQLVERYLANPGIVGTLHPTVDVPEILHLKLNRDSRHELAVRVRALAAPNQNTLEFARELESDGKVLVTFDQYTAVEHRSTAFITPIHALAQLSVTQFAPQPVPIVGTIELRSPSYRTGTYVFVAEIWETIAIRPDVRLMCVAVDVTTGQVEPEVGNAIPSILSAPVTCAMEASPPGAELVDRAAEIATAHLQRKRRSSIDELVSMNDSLLQRKLSSLLASNDARLQRINNDLETATDVRIIKMKTAQRARVETQLAAELRKLEDRRDVDIVTHRIAAGILAVNHGE